VKLAVSEGDHVVAGDLVVVLEAMKMEQPMTAHKDGTVSSIGVSVGETVAGGHVLLTIADA
jgi:acetyl-CoA/propionyl-CoA carboxylase, biotin carboxylase, biotin carboxyl carrier protein